VRFRRGIAQVGAATLGLSMIVVVSGAPAAQALPPTPQTPIQHLVVIFQENESFDHYFGTYPYATNPTGEDGFTPALGTPSVDGLCSANAVPSTANNVSCTSANVGTSPLLTSNPNVANPGRLDPGPNASGVYNTGLNTTTHTNAGIDDTLTCQDNHNYEPEQIAFDGGAMNNFPGTVGPKASTTDPEGDTACNPDNVLNYYDGNTVTGYWNYAQHYALNDNSFGTTFGPSTPGAINVVSGDTGNFNLVNNAATPNSTTAPAAANTALVADAQGGWSNINDADPFYDDCSSTSSNIGDNNTSSAGPTSLNVGDLLNEAGLSWGFFEGGFTPTTPPSTLPAPGYSGGPAAQAHGAVCGASHPIGAALGGTGATGSQPYGNEGDYIQHHQPFQYFATTANPGHIAPASLSAIGTDTQTFSGGCYGCGTPNFDTANHEYDISYFNQLVSALAHGSTSVALPAVSYLKAPAYEDEHPGYSDPVDGQQFVTQQVNALMQTPEWPSTAVIVAYDDSDGWYDHIYSGNETTPYNGTAQTPAVEQNQSSAGGTPGISATPSTTAVASTGDAENPPLCGGTPIVGTTPLASSTTIGTTNNQITYNIGGGSSQTLTITSGTYTPTTLATKIAAVASPASSITAEVNASGDLVLTDNGLSALNITGGDALGTLGISGTPSSAPASPTLTNTAGQVDNGRCGFGPRLPLLVISPYAKSNFVDNTLSDQASVVNFIEYNWKLPTIPGSADHLLTNPSTTFDLANMFDFTPGATDVAGPAAYYLSSTTFQPTTMPTPLLPDSKTPVLFIISGIVVLGGASLVLGRRQRRRRTSAA